MQVPINEAKTQLSKLIEASLAGEDVVISRGRLPVVKLVPVQTAFAFGLLQGRVATSPSFDEPMSEDELRNWGLG